MRPLDAQELLLSARREKVDRVVEARTRALVVVLEDLEDPHNIAAVLRTCEAMGVQEIHAITRHYAFHPNSKITNGAEKWLDLHLHRDGTPCLDALEKRGYLLCATDLGEGAGSLLDLPIERPLALVFGTEKVGLTASTLARCAVRFKIPTSGFSQSLNISVAAAICIAQITFARRALPQSPPLTLPEPEKAGLKARFYALSVKQRHRLFAREELSVNGLPNTRGGRTSKP